MKKTFYLSAIVTIILVSFSITAFAAPTHNSTLSAILCKSNGTLTLKGTAASWKSDSAGTNTAVRIDATVVDANRSVQSLWIGTGIYTTTTTPKNSFTFEYQGLPTTTVTVTVFSTASGTWGDGSTNHPVNQTTAVFVGDCPVTTKLTPTPEPPTATATSTNTPTATPTDTPTTTQTPTSTPTNTPTITPTSTPTWDRSSLSVMGNCVGGVPVFAITNNGQTMKSSTLWTVYVDNVLTEQGFLQVNANETKSMPFVGAQFVGVLRFTVQQAIGHPGNSLPQATIDGSDCTIAPTADGTTGEPSTFEVVYLGTEIIEGETPYDVWYINCHVSKPKLVTLTINISFTHGGFEVRHGKYCNTKIYLLGSVSNMSVAAAMIEPETIAVRSIYLPIVSR